MFVQPQMQHLIEELELYARNYHRLIHRIISPFKEKRGDNSINNYALHQGVRIVYSNHRGRKIIISLSIISLSIISIPMILTTEI